MSKTRPTMPSKRRNQIAAIVLLALAAGTAVRTVRLRSWRREGLGRPEPETWDAAGHSSRRLMSARRLRKAKERRIKTAELAESRRERTLEALRDNRDEIWRRDNGGRLEEVRDAAEAFADAEEKLALEKLEDDYEPLTVCGRPADVGSEEDFESLQKYMQCEEITKDKPILVLRGQKSHGRTGNNLIEFLHAVQEARDNDIQLGIVRNSWATALLVKMWLSIKDRHWMSEIERAFCVKVFADERELARWDVIDQDTKELFFYKSEASLGDYMAGQELSIRTLFRNYNTGEGVTTRNQPAGNMCSGIEAIFGADAPDAMYSVIHSRSLEGDPGYRLLRNVSRKSGCDPVAALEMRPDYVKSILEPLGMMRYPIVFITDGQNSEVLARLRADPDIGPMIRTVPPSHCWLGGDLTLGIMSNVFIGNPASTFTGFIAKARLALGFGNNYLFRVKDIYGQWKTVCGDHCIFDKTVMGVMA